MAWLLGFIDLRELLANRETSHYHVFKRRIAELGYAWTDIPDQDYDERLVMFQTWI